MSEYFYLNGNRKDINRLREYLKALAEKPDSGVSVVNVENDEIKELRKRATDDELMEVYIKRQLENPANANDVVFYPKI